MNEQPAVDGAPPGKQEREVRSLYRHPLAAVGGALMLAGSLAFVLLILVDIGSNTENPYRSLVTFIGVPFVITVGLLVFLIAIRLQVVSARKRGELVRFSLRIEPTDERYMRNLWLFLGLGIVGILVVGFAGLRAYEATETTDFCGEVCHEVMEPEHVTHQDSPHARVACVECHIGSGASYWVRSKLDGIRQVWAVTLGSYDRPLEGPFELRPARETCEECHWPESFDGSKLVSQTFWSLNETNSPWTISLVLDIGRETRSSDPAGIHWHMLTENQVEYIASDPERQDIQWVRVKKIDGTVSTYTRDGGYVAREDDPEIRAFDCLDCHNRPSHTFEPPSDAMNTAFSSGRLPQDLPFLKREGLDLLLGEYSDREEAHTAISVGLMAFYVDQYPDLAVERNSEIVAAAETLIEIFDANFFPEMRTDFRSHLNNAGHRSSEGCFRCHDGQMLSSDGAAITNDCNACHLIIGQGLGSDPEATDPDLAGVEFDHPGEVGDKWRERTCASCHLGFDGF